MPHDGPTIENVRAALDEILGWQGIARSPQLAELLRYVVDKTLAGEGPSIKAYSIAVDVFRRPVDFDPQADPIVRVQARRLRALLEQYYGSGAGRSDVEIRLPLGRYVPEFSRREIAGVAPAARDPAPEARPRGRPKPQRPALESFLSGAMVALAFALVAVLLAVFIVRWTPPAAIIADGQPATPEISIGTFDNLTGQPGLDDEVAEIGRRLAADLGEFEWLRAGGDGYRVNGTMQQVDGRFILRANLVQASGEALWTTTINAPTGVEDRAAFLGAEAVLAAQLGSSSGPVHAAGRSWLKLQTSLAGQPTHYVCDLSYMNWRDSRGVAEAERASACFGRLLQSEPDNAIALAAAADIASWRAVREAGSADNLSDLQSSAAADAARAVTMQPGRSFVYERHAAVLARQQSVSAARGAVRRALELNPANMDALALEGQLLFADGAYDEGAARGEQALATVPFAPPWYYLTRALQAVRQERFFDAIDAALALAPGDDEIAPVIALMAAPRTGRPDLVDRYRPMVLGNAHFQHSGIMPRLAMRISAPGVLQRIRDGLVLAGLPTNALDRPFNADGSARAD